MNETFPTQSQAAPLSVARHVDVVCDRFEDAWRAGKRPRLEDYLAEATGTQRATLLRDLLPVEIACRRQSGETPSADEYQSRFPDLDQTWLTPLFGDRNLETIATSGPGTATPAPVSSAASLRYRILRPHAKGGLGEVFVAEDTELHREVALKEIQDRHADDPNSRSRFLLEAEITGRLEHPGIVPVYGLGQYLDGRPFYAMRFIQGDSFEEAIQRFHEADGPTRDPGERALALRKLLGQFHAVCEAVAYAHSRGVLHRDLKPSNIMLGRYGETLLVDWGLAKVVGRPDNTTATTVEQPLETFSGSGTAPTMMGAAIGTPRYMSPEQAAGQLDQLGPATDIYSLGATLYNLLTGRTPFEDKHLHVVLERVRRGDWLPPRAVKRDVPPPLDAICRKAMALNPDDRYATAEALAEDIEHWLADEPVSAYHEPFRVRAGRWARRHKLLVTATATSVLLIAIFGGAGAWWLDRQHAERLAEQQRLADRQVREVKTAIADVTRLQGQSRWEDARSILKQATDRLGDTDSPELLERLQEAARNLELVARLDTIRLEMATRIPTTLAEGKFDYARTSRAYAEAFEDAGLGKVGDDTEEVARRVRTSAVREQLVAALDDWTACIQWSAERIPYLASAGVSGYTASCLLAEPQQDWVQEVARHADPDPWRDQARSKTSRRDRAELERLAAKEAAADQSSQLVNATAVRLRKAEGDGTPLLRRAISRRPDDFWLNLYLGSVLETSSPWEGLGYLKVAIALRPDTAAVHNNLGVLLRTLRRSAEAEEEYRKAIALDPHFAAPHAHLIWLLLDQGRAGEAEQEYRQALALNPSYSPSPNNLGWLLYNVGRFDEAEVEYHKAIDLDPRFAAPHNNLGWLLFQLGRWQEAQGHFEAAIDFDPHFAQPHTNLGWLFYNQSRLADARAEYNKAIAIDPKYGLPHTNLGWLLANRGNWQEAMAEYRIAERLGDKDGTKQLKRCQHLLALLPRLPAVTRGDDKPANVTEKVDFAYLCQLPNQERYAASARLYAEAFADPAMTEEIRQSHRYEAACAAARAGCGQGADAGDLSNEEKARWRQQALDWLRADLARWAKHAQSDKAQERGTAGQMLQRWQHDPALAVVRDADALQSLPESEGSAWQRLWIEVAELVKPFQREK